MSEGETGDEAKGPGRAPGPGEVTFRVERWLPFLDHEGDAAEGETRGGDVLFGAVEAVGDAAEAGLGGREALVFHREKAAAGERLLIRRDRVLAMPPGYPDGPARDAVFAGVAAVIMTSDLARLAASDTVLVLGAESPIGLACCLHARATGARVLAGVEGEADRARLADLRLETVDLADPGWVATCLKGVGRFGVDVVIGATGGKLFDEAFAWVLGNFGRYVLYGPPGEAEVTIDAEELRAGCKTVSGFRISELAERNLERVVRAFRRYAFLVRSEQVPLPEAPSEG